MKRLLSIFGAVTLVGLVALLAAGPDRRRQACIASGLCEQTDFLGAMLVSVQRQQKHVVLSARLVAPITSGRDTTVGPVTLATTRQTAIVPATVNYAVDFQQLKAADLDWDKASQTLTVRRPPVFAMPPVIEWDKATIYADRSFIAAVTEVRQRLEADNREKAPGVFAAQAASADLKQIADRAADEAVAALFLMPLIAAGNENAKVVVTR